MVMVKFSINHGMIGWKIMENPHQSSESLKKDWNCILHLSWSGSFEWRENATFHATFHPTDKSIDARDVLVHLQDREQPGWNGL